MARPFNASTPLGQMMRARAMSVQQLQAKTGIHNRTISNYLADREPILGSHLVRLCEALDCFPEEIRSRPLIGV